MFFQTSASQAAQNQSLGSRQILAAAPQIRLIPVGIVTSLVGVPFFLSIILRHRGQV